MISAAVITLMAAVFVASIVETVEALTIVLAMGLTRSWKSALVGAGSALCALALVTAAIMLLLDQFMDQIQTVESLLQLVIGVLLTIFGMQWLRKAILRYTGLKAIHDEELIFERERQAALSASREERMGLDWFAFVVSFKGVFLEGVEVVFIVITFGLAAMTDRVAPMENAIFLAAMAALIGAVFVGIVGAVAHKPLSRVPENTMKFAVGLLLSTFGVYWFVEGLGFFHPESQSLNWPTGTWALPLIFFAWLFVSITTIAILKPMARRNSTANTFSSRP